MIEAIMTINAQLHSIQGKLDALLNADSSVPKEQLKELTEETRKLKAKSDLLTQAIEKQK